MQSPERSRAPRVIGGLPIAEYEGSPRRYGPRPLESPGLPSAQSLLSSPSVFPPRPGFPQRVVQAASEEEPQTPPSSQQQPSQPPQPSTEPGAYDYLYEFSETRKVLEEFFKPGSPAAQPPAEGFHELDYNLHRQAGNSYVGQRLAKDGASPGAAHEPEPEHPENEAEDETTPRVHKAGGTPDLISLRDHEDPAATEHVVLVVPADPEEDLAETEVSDLVTPREGSRYNGLCVAGGASGGPFAQLYAVTRDHRL